MYWTANSGPTVHNTDIKKYGYLINYVKRQQIMSHSWDCIQNWIWKKWLILQANSSMMPD